MKNLFQIILILLVFTSTLKPQTNSVQNDLDNILSSPFFETTQAAVKIYDLTNDSLVYSKNEKLLFHPASVQKILTSGTALFFLGTDYNFKTSFYYTGSIDDSVCSGNLYVTGGFDPMFSQKDLDSVVQIIKEAGINRINGNLYADISAGDSLIWGSGWMWDDDPGSYAAYLSPLTINENCIKVVVSPGGINEPPSVNLIPDNNFIPIKNYGVTADTGQTNLKITRDWLNRSNEIIVKGNIFYTRDPDTVTINVFNPTNYFLKLMRESLDRHKIILSGILDTLALPEDNEEIFTFERNIDSVVAYTNKNSYNLGAEMLLRALAAIDKTKPATAKKGIVFIDSLIAISGSDPRNYRIADGSGLSFYNLVSAELITKILKYFYAEEDDLYEVLYNSFPVAGIDGTLEHRMENSEANNSVHAKTGTLSGVSNLAGYINTKSGKLLAFTILIQNYPNGSAQAHLIQDKICELLYKEL